MSARLPLRYLFPFAQTLTKGRGRKGLTSRIYHEEGTKRLLLGAEEGMKPGDSGWNRDISTLMAPA